MIPELTVTFLDTDVVLQPGDTLTFGRQADLVIDDANRHLHRRLGRFSCIDGVWWLHNEGRAIPLLLADRHTSSSSLVAPGTSTAVSFAEAILRFGAGGAEYELELKAPSTSGGALVSDGTDTISAADMPLTADQLLLLVGLAQNRLRDPHGPIVIPKNQDIAEQLRWGITKFNRKLDNVSDKFHKAGVRGLRGSERQLASDRRMRLVEYVTAAGLVTADDLPLLDEAARSST